MRPIDVTRAARGAVVVGGMGVALLMLAPMFQGAEQMFGLTDKQAHGLAFYVATLTAMLSLPRMRRTDLALAMLALGAAAEMAQAITGRSASFTDLSADAVGIFAAWAPSQVERLRYLSRNYPYRTFAEIRAGDRRRSQPVLALPPPSPISRPTP